MKIPTSSSFFLASLAISSSSSCLAAPAGDSTQDTALTTSSSKTHMSSLYVAPAPQEVQDRSDTIVERTVAYPGRLDARGEVLPGVVNLVGGIPILGPLLGPILQKILTPAAKAVDGTHSMDVDGTNSTQDVNPQQMEALQSAITEITRIINGTLPVPAPDPVKNVAGNVTPILPLSNDDSPNNGTESSTVSSAYPSSSVTPTPQAAAADVDTSSSTYSSASASPSSPAMPKNPPNTPSAPLPALPVNV